ncbi:MAG: hypothetical protein V1839_02635 [archaeon]
MAATMDIRDIEQREFNVRNKIERLVEVIVKLGEKSCPEKFNAVFKDIHKKNEALINTEKQWLWAEKNYNIYKNVPVKALHWLAMIITLDKQYSFELINIAGEILQKLGKMPDFKNWQKVLLALVKTEEQLNKEEIVLLEKYGFHK